MDEWQTCIVPNTVVRLCLVPLLAVTSIKHLINKKHILQDEFSVLLFSGQVMAKEVEPRLRSLQENCHAEQAPVSPQSSNTLTRDKITENSWKYVGYEGYSDYVAHINDFLIIRRFGALTVRVLLALQDQVVVIEERLKKLDAIYSRPNSESVHNGSFRGDRDDRKALLLEARSSLKEYYSFAKLFSNFAGHPEPSTCDVQSLNDWQEEYKYCIYTPEREYLNSTNRTDLFSLVPKTKTPLRKLLEKFNRLLDHKFFRREEPSTLPEHEKGKITYCSEKAMERMATVIIITLGLAMLLAPAWILEFLNNQIAKLGVISAFVILFTGTVQYALIIRPGEALAAAAAYSAVLMVFLQLGNSK